MSVPKTSIQPEVNYFLLLQSEAMGEAPSKFSAFDLQAIAYGIRAALPDLDEEAVPTMIGCANAIDGLSDLGDDELAYLEGLTGKS